MRPSMVCASALRFPHFCACVVTGRMNGPAALLLCFAKSGHAGTRPVVGAGHRAWGCLLDRCREFLRCPGARGLWEVHGRPIRGRPRVPGACYAGCAPGQPGCAGGSGWVAPPSSFPAPVHPAPRLLPAALGSCTGLYVAVRRIGGADDPVHAHITGSVHRRPASPSTRAVRVIRLGKEAAHGLAGPEDVRLARRLRRIN